MLGVLGIVNSIWASALLLLINNKITGEPLPFFDQHDWIVYLVLICVSLFISLTFQSYMIKLTYNLGNELNLSLFDKLRFTNYEDYVKLSEEKVRTAIDDVEMVQKFPQTFMDTFNSSIMVIIGIAYLFYVNWVGALLVFLSIVLLAVIYVYRNYQIEKDVEEARDLANVYIQNIDDFLDGFKEVKMNKKISHNIFYNYIAKNRTKAKDLIIRIMVRNLGNELLGTYAWYIMIGVVLFLLPFFLTVDLAVKTNFLVTLLFLMGPIGVLIGAMDKFIHMRVALRRINIFNETIDAKAIAERSGKDNLDTEAPFKQIEFKEVTYEYYDRKKEATFKLKPLNINIEKGESIFVTGGNGSGKSTFIDLLSGLTIPKSGKIFYNGTEITDENSHSYRNTMSSIFYR